jgi:hypothetical protein
MLEWECSCVENQSDFFSAKQVPYLNHPQSYLNGAIEQRHHSVTRCDSVPFSEMSNFSDSPNFSQGVNGILLGNVAGNTAPKFHGKKPTAFASHQQSLSPAEHKGDSNSVRR